MKLSWLFLCLIAVAICLSASSIAQSSDFQTGTVVEVETLPSQSAANSGGTDAPLTSDVNEHDVSIKLGDAVYVCRAKTMGGVDLSWAKGKEVSAKVNGNVMYVKRANGKVAKLSILKTTKAD